MKLSDFPTHVQRQIIKDNPHAFPNNPVDRSLSQKSQPDKGCEGQNSKLEGSEERRGYRIKLIQLRRRLLDEHDNLAGSLKAVVDRITERLGFSSDNDPLLQWSYGQIQTKGREGVVVIIEPL